MSGLVLAGGAFRGLFSCGVLDALLDEDIIFPYTIGVSSGCSYGVSYVSRQRGRNWKMTEVLAASKSYVSLKNYCKHKSLIDIDLAFNKMSELFPMDFDTFYNSPERFVTLACDAKDLKPLYFEKHELDRQNILMRGSCALPPFLPAVEYKGHKLIDGGMYEPVPLLRSIEDGNTANLVVFTKPRDYRHSLKWDEWIYSVYYKFINKEASDWLKKRPASMNEIYEICDKRDGDGDLIALYVKNEDMISRFDKDIDKLKALYDAGYESVMSRLREIKDLVIRK